jgi:hypothetical protein
MGLQMLQKRHIEHVFICGQLIIGGRSRVILCSRSRVAPVKKVSLPRLELCRAILLAGLVDKILPALNVEKNNVHLWTDSTIVLSWISLPARKWNTFVANRVARIQKATKVSDWKCTYFGQSC